MATVELAACQVHVTADDYASHRSFEAMLARVGERLDAARDKDATGAPRYECLAVFPEMIGAFLPLVDNLALCRGARTTDAALARVGVASLPSLLGAMIRHRVASPKVGFLLAASPEVWRIYRGAFSRFARAHRAWVVAGSALLPRNAHGDLADRFAPADGRVYNTSFAFSPDGEHVASARKVNLVPTLEDTLGLTPGRAEDLAPFDAPFGKVETLVCYDGFRVAHTEREPGFCPLLARCDEAGAVVLAQPAANPWPWEARWTFGSRGPVAPRPRAAPDPGRPRSAQWFDEGLSSQLAASSLAHVRFAVTAQLLGGVFDNRFDGRSHVLDRHGRVVAQASRADASPEAEEVVLARVEP
jgi:predicted amidohydrolase